MQNFLNSLISLLPQLVLSTIMGVNVYEYAIFLGTVLTRGYSPMNKIYVIFVFCSILVLSIACNNSYISAPAAQSSTSIPKIEPYKFELGKMMISPPEIEVDKPVFISVPIQNVGSEANSYVGTLKVNNDIIGTRDIKLDPGEGGVLTYTLILHEPGSYKLKISDLEQSIVALKINKFIIPIDSINLLPSSNCAADYLPHRITVIPPVKPFIISRINFSYGTPESLKILDSNEKELYSINLGSESAITPYLEVADIFIVQFISGRAKVVVKSERYGGWGQSPGWGTTTYSQYFYPEITSIEGIQKMSRALSGRLW